MTDPQPVPQIMNVWQFLILALPIFFTFMLSMAGIILSYYNHQNIKVTSEKQESIVNKQDVLVNKQDDLSHKINGLTTALVKSTGDARHAEGVIDGVAEEQKRSTDRKDCNA